MNALGRHILVEFYNCDKGLINDLAHVEESMKEAARVAGATIVKSVFHLFNPHGVSGVVVIAESHLAIHTWPEYGYCAIDLFTCGDEVNPWHSFDFLKEQFKCANVFTMELKRGQLSGDVIQHKPPC
ncbi:MAG: adenosylmethionine decarboxylase [Candidatus Wallbacteria bacterium]|nr:adenosylmethionine decarboxylase [Candidatus Wallbacteria bacterium]